MSSLFQYNTILIGFGKIAAGYSEDFEMKKYYEYVSHIEVLKAHPRLNCLTVVEPLEDARKIAEDNWNIAMTFKTVEEVKGKHDIAVLAIPPKYRLSSLKKLEGIRAVLVEKPLGENFEEAKELVEYCKENNIALQVNYFRRADQIFRKFATDKLVKMVGEIQNVIIIYGNGWKNNGVHMVDFVRMLFGEVEEIIFAKIRDGYQTILESDLNIDLILKIRCRQSGNPINVNFIATDFKNFREIKVDIYGTKGRMVIYQEGLFIRYFKVGDNRANKGEKEVLFDDFIKVDSTVGKALYYIHDNLLNYLEGTEKLYSDGENALKTEKIVQKALDFAKEY